MYSCAMLWLVEGVLIYLPFKYTQKPYTTFGKKWETSPENTTLYLQYCMGY